MFTKNADVRHIFHKIVRVVEKISYKVSFVSFSFSDWLQVVFLLNIPMLMPDVHLFMACPNMGKE